MMPRIQGPPVTAEIRTLQGETVSPEEVGRDPKIAECLAELGRKNDAGRLKAIAVVYLTPEDWFGASWAWGVTDKPMGLLAIGAIEALKDEMLAGLRHSPEMPEPSA